jgi:hypothetical protein
MPGTFRLVFEWGNLQFPHAPFWPRELAAFDGSTRVSFRLSITLSIVLALICGTVSAESRPAVEGDGETARQVGRVDEALARRDVSAAVRAWHDAYVFALASRQWEPMIAVADAYLRIGQVSGHAAAARGKARSHYLTALIRAERQRSVDGVLRVAEAFARLGDREVVARTVGIAEALAARSGDRRAVERVEQFTRHLVICPCDLGRSEGTGSVVSHGGGTGR